MFYSGKPNATNPPGNHYEWVLLGTIISKNGIGLWPGLPTLAIMNQCSPLIFFGEPSRFYQTRGRRWLSNCPRSSDGVHPNLPSSHTFHCRPALERSMLHDAARVYLKMGMPHFMVILSYLLLWGK